MIKDKYLEQITATVNSHVKGKSVQVFLFGSSVRKQKFGDFDVGLLGKVSAELVRKLKHAFEDSTLPYKADVIDFNQVTEVFKANVFRESIIWIKR